MKKRVVILGGGFGGLECAKRLDGVDVEITLIDRQNHHLFQPLLYQVASAGLAAPDIAHPIRTILTNQKNVTVVMAEIEDVSLEDEEVYTSAGTFEYDYLVVALGVTHGFFGNDHWAEHVRGLKTLDEATAIRRDLLHAFEQAENCDDEEERKKLMTVVVIGGGPTGVELAGAFAELDRHVLHRDFRHIDTDAATVYLIEAMDRLLLMYDEDLSEYTRESLEEMGVTVLTGSPVKDIKEGVVILDDQKIEAATIVWGAGVQGVPLTKRLGVETDRGGRIMVDSDLHPKDHPNVFVVGDIANCTDQAGVRVPGVSPAAMQMGKHVARVIEDDVEGNHSGDYSARQQFRYFDKGSMATIGRSKAVAAVAGKKFTGFFAWLLWLFVHLLFLVSLRNRIKVFINWCYAYFNYRLGARIITGLSRKQCDKPEEPKVVRKKTA
ncbi:MAG: NAD(P)/FAD-dependent oxidoreductase [Verrucomicrobiota bacterium]